MIRGARTPGKFYQTVTNMWNWKISGKAKVLVSLLLHFILRTIRPIQSSLINESYVLSLALLRHLVPYFNAIWGIL